MNLNDIVRSAQGGQAVDNIAARFGLSPDQARNAINALLPAFQMGLQNTAGSGGGLGSILQHLGNGAHQDSYADPGAAQSPAATQAGGSVLGDLFGGHAATGQVAQQASTQSGVSASVIQAMMPMLASLIMGGLFHGAQQGGFGGLLQSMIGGGGLGSIFGGQAPPTAPAGPAGAEEGGLGGVLGSVLGGLFGGGGPGSSATPAPASPPASSDADAALDRFSQMFQAGTPAAPQHEASLANILGR